MEQALQELYEGAEYAQGQYIKKQIEDGCISENGGGFKSTLNLWKTN